MLVDNVDNYMVRWMMMVNNSWSWHRHCILFSCLVWPKPLPRPLFHPMWSCFVEGPLQHNMIPHSWRYPARWGSGQPWSPTASAGSSTVRFLINCELKDEENLDVIVFWSRQLDVENLFTCKWVHHFKVVQEVKRTPKLIVLMGIHRT